MIRPAKPEDCAAVKQIAELAYAHYISRIGEKPAPMVADFDAHVARGEVSVVEVENEVQGFIIQHPKVDDWFVENLAVSPKVQDQGLGKALMAFAETEAQKRKKARVFLYTNAKMTESLDFYTRLGYAETHRVTEDGFHRIYMEKRLESCS